MDHKQKGSITLLVSVVLGLIVSSGLFLKINNDLKQERLKLEIKESQVNLGAFRPSKYTGKLLTRLNEGGSETTFNTSPGEAADGTTLTTAKLGDFIVLTINPGASNEEKISVSAISTTASTTATWTIINRGLSFTSNVKVTGNVKQHAIGETIIISNDDHYLAEQYVSTDDAQQISGNKYILGTFGFRLNATSTSDCSLSTEYCRKNYVDALAFQGVATATESVIGAVRLTQNSLVGTNQASSSSGAPLVLLNRDASSLYKAASSSQLVVTNSSNFIDRNFIATSSSDVYTFGAPITFSNILNASSSLLVATRLSVASSSPSTTVNLSVNGGALISGTTTVGGLVATSSVSFTSNVNSATTTYVGGILVDSNCVSTNNSGCLGYSFAYSTSTANLGSGTYDDTRTIGFRPTALSGTAYLDVNNNTDVLCSFSWTATLGHIHWGGLQTNNSQAGGNDRTNLCKSDQASDDMTVTVNASSATTITIRYAVTAGNAILYMNAVIIGEK